jgi:formylglycine-generating enzyme required for sulfatase activity
VSREDAEAFCAWLSKKDGRTYSLPSDEQWEFACRAGTQSRWFWGDDPALAIRYAWFEDPATGSRQMPVGHKLPNAFGLFDMAGNIAEMAIDAQGKIVFRGGHAGYPQMQMRSAVREYERLPDPTYRNGFRVAIVGELKNADPATK